MTKIIRRIKSKCHEIHRCMPEKLYWIILLSLIFTVALSDFRLALGLSAYHWYGVITAIPVHASFAQLTSDMIYLVMIGWIFDSMTSRGNLNFIFITSALVANIIVLCDLIRTHSDMEVMGTSGGVTGLIGACGVIDLYYIGKHLLRRFRHEKDVWHGYLGIKLAVVVLLGMTFLDVEQLTTITGMYSFLIHAAGIVTGIILGVCVLVYRHLKLN